MDRKSSKTVPLSANTRGNVGDGFELASRSLVPDTVTVEGPAGALDSITELSTEAIDLEGKNGNFVQTARILNPDPLVSIRGAGTAEFEARIRPLIPAMNIGGIPITVKGLDPRFEANPDGGTGSVRLEGRQELLDMFVPAPDFFSVDCSALYAPGTYTLPVLIEHLPEGIVPARRDPQELRLTVALKGTGF